MLMPRLALLAALAALGGPAAATAAPVSTGPPKIGGTPRFLGTAVCDKGTWSGSPVSFTYSWLFGGSPFASGPRFPIDKPNLMGGQSIACRVTATDAGGAPATATSAPVKPALGLSTMKITSITTQSQGRFTIKGVIGPKALVTTYARGLSVVLNRRINKTTVVQLGVPAGVARSGRFVVKGTDRAGRRRVLIRFLPGSAFGLFAPLEVTRTVTVTPGGRAFGGGSVGVG
jgi:hypothetical protein